MATATRDWSESEPTNATYADLIDNHIRYVRTDIRERLAIEHEMDSTDTGQTDLADIGLHKKITFTGPQAANPDTGENKGCIYTKDVTGKAELHWKDEDDNVIQFTSAGKIKLSENIGQLASADILLNNNAPLRAKDNAGTGSVQLIKANTSDEAEIPVDLVCGGTVDVTGKITADETEEGDDDDVVATKGYVDNAAAAAFSPSSYDGEESVTFPNGLIMKTGYRAGGGGGEVVFDTAFSSIVVSVQVTSMRASSAGDANATITSTPSVTGFTAVIPAGDLGFYWIALGK